MAPPTGSSSSPTSSRTEEISDSVDTPLVVQLGGTALGRAQHALRPWLIHQAPDSHSMGAAVAGRLHSGIEWISASPSVFSGNGKARQRLILNARPVTVMRPRRMPIDPDRMLCLAVNNSGDFRLHAPFPGIHIPPEGRYFPPGSLQIIVDEDERQVVDQFTTLPEPVRVSSSPCSGWCKRQHIFSNFGLSEQAVVFFDRHGWPIACRENMLDHQFGRSWIRWWRFDYSRPQPEVWA